MADRTAPATVLSVIDMRSPKFTLPRNERPPLIAVSLEPHSEARVVAFARPRREASCAGAVLVTILFALFFEGALWAQVAKGPETSLTSLEQVLETVPRNLILAVRGGNKNDAAAKEATDVLRSKVEGQSATLKFKVDKIEKERRKDEQFDRYSIKAEDARVRNSVTTFKAFLWVHIVPAESAKVIALKKGDELTITGKIAVAKISVQTPPQLNIDVVEAVLK